jgi:hypothetical protein
MRSALNSPGVELLIVASAAKADSAAWSDPVGLVGHLVDGATTGIDQDDGVALVAKLSCRVPEAVTTTPPPATVSVDPCGRRRHPPAQPVS